MNTSIKVEDSFKKKIGKYLISFCQTQYYGKSLHGQMRAGYQQGNNKLFIFRINPLPLTNNMKSFLALQKTYSDLKQYSRVVYEDINSSSFNYSALQYFPKTFQTQIANFSKNQKYLDEMVQKFLKTYSFFYNMKVSHGNLLPSNIGITFDGRVKLMDFQTLPEDSNDETFRKDFQNFKSFVSRVLQKDSNYPYKFNSFNSKQTERWQHLFSSWHITSPLEPVYLSRKNYIQNIVTGLYKLQTSFDDIYDKFNDAQSELQHDSNQQENDENGQNNAISRQDPFVMTEVEKLNDLKMVIRLLQLNYLCQGHEQKLDRERESLEDVIGSLEDYDLDYYNSVLIGVIRDFKYYNIDPSRRLFLLSCLVPTLNHEYILYQITKQLKENEQYSQRNLLLGDSLFSKYKTEIFKNLLKKPPQKPLF